MAHCIVCHNTNCKYNYKYNCEAAKIEVGTDCRCLTRGPKDIYKEAEGFGRDGQAD